MLKGTKWNRKGTQQKQKMKAFWLNFICGLKWREREGFNSRFIFVLPLTFCHVCLLRFASSPCHPCPLDAHCDWYRPRRRSTRFGNLHLTFLWTRRVCKRREKKKGKKKDDQTKQGLQRWKRYIKKGATEEKTFKNENSKRKMFKNTSE